MANGKIATAYVQVMPSMEGVAPKVKSFFGGAGKEASHSFGGGLASTIKTALVSAGVGTALKEALSQGADMQQSLGGIETLFKSDAESVIAAANQAYKTAGMSANEYMETVTSFSASLISSMGGDTKAAAAVADMALRDMSDNANKMGTDMESIQNAYQGFAKQNYTMLDNLKLGYGGTKTEMQRLLKDAQKITGIKYDIGNLSDVYSAINVIQTQLGITGTTAMEASTTLTGSFSSMKAAFSDVLGNLALGNDMQPSLEALASSTKTFLMGNLVPMVGNIFRALPGTVSTLVKELVPGSAEDVVHSISSNFKTFMETKAPEILASGGETLRSWAQGIKEFLPELGAAAGDMIVALGEFLTDPENLAEMGRTVWDVGSAIVEGIAEGIGAAFVKVYDKLQGLFGTLSTNMEFQTTGTFTPAAIPGYATGLDYVPRDNFIARLHEGEMVLTKAQANAYRGGQTGGGVIVNQHFYDHYKTAADQQAAARYEQEKAVLGLG